MNANNSSNGSWPYHPYDGKDPRKQGTLIKCANNPCKLHGNNDIYASSEEEAYEKLHESKTKTMMQTGMSDSDKGKDNALRKDDVPVYYGVFFNDTDKFYDYVRSQLSAQGITSQPLDERTLHPHITFGFKQKPDEEFNEIHKINGIKVIGYGNDGRNEGIACEIPDKFKPLYHGSDVIHITLSKTHDSKAVDTAYIDYKPIAKPFYISGQAGAYYNNASKMNTRKQAFGSKPLKPTGWSGDILQRKHFNGTVNHVNDCITDDDWEHLTSMTNTLMSTFENAYMNDTDKQVIYDKVLSYLESDDENAMKYRDYCGKDVNMQDVADILVNNVSAMTRRLSYPNTKNIRRCLLSSTSNDMNKRRYIASVMFFGGRCCYCQVPLKRAVEGGGLANTATGEHLDPLDGNPPGETKFGNMALCCKKCNKSKANKPLDDWMNSTTIISDAQKQASMSMITSFRDLSLYEPMSAGKARIVNKCIDRLDRMRENGMSVKEIKAELHKSILRIQQAN